MNGATDDVVEFWYWVQDELFNKMEDINATAHECPYMLAFRFPQRSSTYEDAVAYLISTRLMTDFVTDIVLLPTRFYGKCSDLLSRFPELREGVRMHPPQWIKACFRLSR